MRTQTILFCLVVLTVMVSSKGFDFDFDRTEIIKEGQYNVIRFPCTGGSGNYEYEFKGIPAGWFAKKDKLYVPNGYFNPNKYYGIKVGVYDKSYGKFLRRGLLFAVDSQRVKDCFDVDYQIDLSVQSQIQQIVRGRGRQNGRGGINLVYTFPDISEIEEYVSRGDIVYLRKVIDAAISSQRNCKQISGFLSRFLSTIRAHLSVLTINNEENRREIIVLEQQIEFIRQEIQSLKGQTINVEVLRRRIAQFRQQIENLRFQTNEQTQFIVKAQSDIKIHEQEIYELRVTVIGEAKRDAEEAETKIGAIDQEINQLNKKISLLKVERTKFHRLRENSLRIIEENEAKVQSLTRLIERQQYNIGIAKQKITQFEENIRVLSIEIGQLEEQISNAVSFEAIKKLTETLSVKTQLIVEKRQTVQTIEKLIFNLQKTLVSFQTRFNAHYYSCFEILEVDKENQTVSVVSDAFTSYLKQIFGYKASSNIRSRFSGSGKVKLHSVSIFSPAWIKVFGIPYSAGYGNNMDIMETQFSCETIEEQDTDLSVFNGQILKVDRNFINVRDNSGEDYTVHLGGCTRIETATDKQIPQIGDQIYFKGRSRKNTNKGRHYNGYHITCY